MKKIFTLLLLISSFNFGATGWYNDFITINSTLYYIGGNPGSGTYLDGANLGTVLSLEISSADMKYWSDNQDRTGGAFYYKIMSSDNSTEIVATTETIWTQTYLGGNDYQGTWTGTIDLLSGLSAGTTYKLHIWAKSWGMFQGDSWLSNNSNNYVATFTTDNAFPVQLTAFTVRMTKAAAQLNWSTATETNNYGFEVERASHTSTSLSVTGWKNIGFVAGNGNSNSPKDYTFVDANPPAGNLQYRLKQIDFDGKFTYSDAVSVNNASAASKFALMPAYPNPFNPTTTIKYSIPASSNVALKIYDVIGNEVATLVNEKKETGEYEVTFNAKDLPSGIYFNTLRANGNVQTQKLLLIK